MPKVLVAGEKTYFVHSFSIEELGATEITCTRNDSVYRIGSVLNEEPTDNKQLESIKKGVIMLLKQSKSWKNAHNNPEMDGFLLVVFRGKNKNAQQSYISTWCGQSESEMLTQNPAALVEQLVKGFKKQFNLKDYHKKSVIHSLINR